MKKSIIFIAIILCVSISGVFASWKYAVGYTAPQTGSSPILINPFSYSPEDILPGGSGTETGEGGTTVTPGENHYKLIDIILNESSKGYGLNYSSTSTLHQLLTSNTILFSNQKITTGNLKFILDSKNNTHGLYYCLQKISSTLYYCYTFSTSDLENAAGSSSEILVYRTSFEKTVKWKATESYIGYAPVVPVSSFGVSADSNSIPYTINVNAWHT